MKPNLDLKWRKKYISQLHRKVTLPISLQDEQQEAEEMP